MEDPSLNINRAANLLKPSEKAIVLFTRGLYFDIDEADGSGWSGYWSTKPYRHLPLDKVIIYNRPQGSAQSEAEVYLADYADALRSTEEPWRSEGRVVVYFRNATQEGTTDRNWYEFADTGTFPVRYLRKD
jgi:hypothetical protein